ncbi:MAG TPA: IS481 family transposase [Gaiellaceae bacterium]|nr:IS481 family transposase [Gaiellaceae bacterium]
MLLHRNAKLGLAGRLALIRAIEAGCSMRKAARRHGVSPATACTWWHRWRAASEEERRTLACLCDRSSRPRRSPAMLSADAQERICEERRRSGHGPRPIAARLGYPHATVWKVLRRGGCSRPERTPEPARRYEWPCPGDLLHADWTTLARFAEPGHAVTGDRTSSAQKKRRKLGYDVVHAIVDDHSRLAYAEVRADAKAATVTSFVERGLAFFASRGIEPQRLMTDNAWSYTLNRSLRELLAARAIKHKRTKPHRPRTNGKVERFIQTLEREWAYGLTYASSEHRRRALPYWLDHYNTRRPHSSLGGRSPISRVQNVCRQDS